MKKLNLLVVPMTDKDGAVTGWSVREVNMIDPWTPDYEAEAVLVDGMKAETLTHCLHKLAAKLNGSGVQYKDVHLTLVRGTVAMPTIASRLALLIDCFMGEEDTECCDNTFPTAYGQGLKDECLRRASKLAIEAALGHVRVEPKWERPRYIAPLGQFHKAVKVGG